MSIDVNILIAYGAAVTRYPKGTMVYRQDDIARQYFQVLEGQVKVFNLSPSSKEFVQGMFQAGESFGEPPLFIRQPYAASAVTTQDSIIIKLASDVFFHLLEEHPEIQKSLLQLFSQKLYDKSIAARMLNQPSPEERLLDFMEYFKKKSSVKSEKIIIPYTRQELANQTGLRIETVIRTLRKLNKDKKVDIINHKVYF